VLSIYNSTDYCWVHEMPALGSASISHR
jgi:hypothetical protein